MKVKQRLCLYCFGSGREAIGGAVCHVCHGHGQYKDYVACALCFGTGRAGRLFAAKVDTSCPNCQGTGKSLVHETGRV